MGPKRPIGGTYFPGATNFLLNVPRGKKAPFKGNWAFPFGGVFPKVRKTFLTGGNSKKPEGCVPGVPTHKSGFQKGGNLRPKSIFRGQNPLGAVLLEGGGDQQKGGF